MSNLIKPYQITVWDDVWDSSTGSFVEKRLGIIGANSMQSQNRAIEPQFTRNVNGVKKLTFKMYARYKDLITGEDIKNPFVDWLISERKVKLFYEDEWHDFVVKNIVENSSNYLYTYQLDDALVQELSKNGFGLVLDDQLMNNIGTANELAERVLAETDWSVSNESEEFVQTIEEPLVYVTIPSGTNYKHILDQSDLTDGISIEDQTFSNPTTVLAFYSCCVNKPHRFQFIWTGTEEKKLDESDKRTIINKNCQYYIDVEDPSTYQEITFDEESLDCGFRGYLPSGFSIAAIEEVPNSDTTVNLSTLYRGRRYGFSQQVIFVPVLNRYVNVFKKDGVEYYGYEKVKYNSPTLTQNVISNTQFESTTGWVGTYIPTTSNDENLEDLTSNKAIVESVFGRFSGNKFISCIDELSDGTFDIEGDSKNNKSYLKVTFQDANSALINSGPFDNRNLIGNMEKDDQWAFRSKWLSSTGEIVNNITTTLGEFEYQVSTGAYDSPNEAKISFSAFSNDNDDDYTTEFDLDGDGVLDTTYQLLKVDSSDYNETQFKKNMQVRLCFKSNTTGIYYLEEAELFKASFTDDKKLIIPSKQGVDLADRVVEKTYKYFLPSALENISSEEELKYESSTKDLVYSVYKPKYNDGAKKVRTVSAKESNYFNILQSIAETFEGWLKLKISRNDSGGITKKEILFKNYVGKENFAGFKYGINLKDIQRTYESKNIVTKLYVKQNSNEHGENGFCTIARANTNPSGETSIYDFKYFQDTGLMNGSDYLNLVDLYAYDSIVGPDKILFDENGKILYTSKDNSDNLSAPNDGIYDTAVDLESEDESEDSSSWYKIANKDTQYYCIKSGDTWGPVMAFNQGNLQGYNPRLKMLNNKIEALNDELINISKDLTKYAADLEVAEVGQKATIAAMEEANATFEGLTSITFSEVDTYKIKKIELDGENKGWSSSDEDDTRKGHIVHDNVDWLSGDFEVSGIGTYDPMITTAEISLSCGLNTADSAQELTVYAYPKLTDSKGSIVDRVVKINCSPSADGTTISGSATVNILQSNRSDIAKCLKKYAVALKENQRHSENKSIAEAGYNATKEQYNKLQATVNQYKILKSLLNQRFFAQYSRFIQEGTWISEEYTDDEKYYLDALSVLYNSCYPQVAYQINTLELSRLAGYEAFAFELGDRTYVEDKEFFGNNYKEKIVITELLENLDDPSKSQIKVQNFKNNFQDLFQKITATVQQAKYSTGAYEKAAAFTDSGQEEKSQFVTDALGAATTRLAAAGQQSVTWGNDGITVKSVQNPSDQIRMVGGAILLSKQDENGQQKWVTGVTSDGVSADLVTTGTLRAGEVQIVSGDDPAFRWDEYGINAFDKDLDGKYNPQKFVRFDRHGLYGISSYDDEKAYVPDSIDQLHKDANFALTWNGISVEAKDGTKLHLGKQNGNLISVTNKEGDKVFGVDDVGQATFTGLGVLNSESSINGKNIVQWFAEQDEKINNIEIGGTGIDFEKTINEIVGKINEEKEKIDSLTAEMIPMSLNGIIVEEGGSAFEDDKSKIFAKVTATTDTTTKAVFYYYKLSEGVYSDTASEYTLTIENSNEKIGEGFLPGAADTTKVYYVKPLQKYLYYDTVDTAWKHTSNIQDIKVPLISYTGLVDRANDTEAILAHLVGYKSLTDSGKTDAQSDFYQSAKDSGAELGGLVQFTKGEFVRIEEYPVSNLDKRNPEKIYYNKSDSKYYRYENNNGWIGSNSLPTTEIYTKNTYYNTVTKKYLVYSDNKWLTYDSLPVKNAAAGFFAMANEDKAEMQNLVNFTKEGLSGEISSAIAGVKATATADKAQTEMLASFISGGKYKTLTEEDVYGENSTDSTPPNYTKFSDQQTVYAIERSASTDKVINGKTDKHYEYWYYKKEGNSGSWKKTFDLSETGLKESFAGFALTAMNGQSLAKLSADLISFDTSYFKVTDGNSTLFQVGNVKSGNNYIPVANLAGWTASRNELVSGDVHLYSGDQSSKTAIGDSGEKNNWRFKASDKFGVDSEGNFYANAGMIGGITIGDIANKSYADQTAKEAVNGLEVGGVNLFSISSIGWYQCDKITQNDNDPYRWTVESLQGSCGPRIVQGLMKTGKNYVLTCKFRKTGGTLKRIGGHSSAYNTTKFLLDGKDLSEGGKTSPQAGYDNITDDGAEHYVEWHFKKINGGTSDDDLYLQLNRADKTAINFEIWEIKLEVGNKATDWSPAQIDTQNSLKTYANSLFNGVNQSVTDTKNEVTKLDTSVRNWLTNGGKTTLGDNYVISPYIGGGYLNITGKGSNATARSVLIDPAGWNSNDPNNYNILKIVSNNDTLMSIDTAGNAEFKGKITTGSGEIAGWKIQEHRLIGPNTNNGKPGIGFAPASGHGCWALWAGEQTGNGEDDKSKGNPYGWDAPFRVGHNGALFAENLAIGKYKNFNPELLQKSDGFHGYIYGKEYGSAASLSGVPVTSFNNNVLVLQAMSNEGAEIFYRLVTPAQNNLWGLKPGKEYCFSGKVSLRHWWHSTNNSANYDIFKNFVVRIECWEEETGTWYEIEKEPIFTRENSYQKIYQDNWNSGWNDIPENYWQSFNINFTIPEKAKGAYVSFQLYRVNEPSSRPNYNGYIYLKDLHLTGGYIPYEAGSIVPNEGIKFWKAPTQESWKQEDNLVFRVDGNGAFIKGHIEATSGKIGNLNIDQIENKLDSSMSSYYSWEFSPDTGISMYKGTKDAGDRVFAVDGGGVYVKGKVDATSGEIGCLNVDSKILKTSHTVEAYVTATFSNNKLTIPSLKNVEQVTLLFGSDITSPPATIKVGGIIHTLNGSELKSWPSDITIDGPFNSEDSTATLSFTNTSTTLNSGTTLKLTYKFPTAIIQESGIGGVFDVHEVTNTSNYKQLYVDPFGRLCTKKS